MVKFYILILGLRNFMLIPFLVNIDNGTNQTPEGGKRSVRIEYKKLKKQNQSINNLKTNSPSTFNVSLLIQKWCNSMTQCRVTMVPQAHTLIHYFNFRRGWVDDPPMLVINWL